MKRTIALFLLGIGLICIGLLGIRSVITGRYQEVRPGSAESQALNAALSRAALMGQPRTVEALLLEGADPNAADPHGLTPLMAAVSWEEYDAVEGGREERYEEIVRLLSDRGAKSDIQDKEGMTALIRACAWGHTGSALILLERGARIDLEDKKGWTALTWAAPSGAKDRLVQNLRERGAQVRLIEALLLEDRVAASALVTHADLRICGPHGETPLMLAVRLGDLGMVRHLLDRGADVNAIADDGSTALMLANGTAPALTLPGGWRSRDIPGTTTNRARIVESLLAAGANPGIRSSQGKSVQHPQ